VDREWRLACAALFLYVAVEMGTAGWIVKYGRDHLSLSEAAAPLCLAVFWGGVGISRMLVSLAADSLSNRRLLLGSIALTLAAQLGVFMVSRPAAALILLGIMGLGMGSVWPTIVSLAGSRFRDSSGIAVGVLVACGACAIPVIQPLIGLAAEPRALGLRTTLLGLSVFTAAELFIVARMGRRGS
jgi:FHS family L-fucose permease-like MFS transporter